MKNREGGIERILTEISMIEQGEQKAAVIQVGEEENREKETIREQREQTEAEIQLASDNRQKIGARRQVIGDRDRQRNRS